MAKNWNPVVVTDQPDEAVFINGRWMQGVNWTLGEEDHEKLRQGFKCIQCMEDWSNTDIGAFPEHCPLCKFPVRESQMFEYEYQFQGEKPVGPQVDVQAELSAMEERRHEREIREGIRSRGVWIPGGDAAA